ncbi:MAG: efflux RND transporter permease subunit [Planctomycetes bacterium]|nr:efflux RND transporter permease subunit [Planctomycetota bacterium]
MNLLRGLIAGGVRNPVLVNLAMVCMLVGGFLSARHMVREAFPEFSLDHITVEVAYPGASPEDVERGVCIPIDEAVRGLSGIAKVTSSASENFGTLALLLSHDVDDPQRVMEAVKERIGQITTFPSETEKPIIKEMVLRAEVISVAIYGDVPERTLKRYAQEVKDDLQTNPAVSQVVLLGVRDDEITIEVSPEALLAYNLTMAQLLDVIARSSLDLPAGVIRTAQEEVTLRVTGQRYEAADYEDLVVIENQDAVVRLGEIATIREGFEEQVRRARFDGQPAAIVVIYKTPKEDSAKIARVVRDYVAARQAWLPQRLRMSIWGDTSTVIDSMIAMLLRNGAMGITLVFITLVMFLELRHAVWVAVGIPVSFAGALTIMYFYGETINIISLFALIMVSGIIVDDAIVIAEHIHTRRRAGDPPELASIEGAHRMVLPVLGSSVTTIIAFVPLLYVVGVMGRFIHVFPVVVIGAIVASAFEAFLILPTHVFDRGVRGGEAQPKRPNRARQFMERAIAHVITRWYRPVYHLAMKNRAVTLSISLVALLIVTGLVVGGRTPLVLLTKDDANIIRARVRFPDGAPVSVAEATIDRLEAAAHMLNDDPEVATASDGRLVRQIYAIVGEFSDIMPVRGSNLCEVRIELMPAEVRRVDVGRIIQRWRHHVGAIHDATEFTIERQALGPTNRPIEIRLFGNDVDDLAEASERIQTRLREFEGVWDVHDDLIPGKRELRVKLRPSSRSLGVTLADVATHLRHGFFGGEAARFQRGRSQVKVRIRYPVEERRAISDLENEWIVTSQGAQIPFHEVATFEWVRSYASIWRQDGQRRIRVRADLDERLANARQILDALESGFLAGVVSDYNDMTYAFGGEREAMDESLASLVDGFTIAVIAIYAVLASILRSYVQPLVIVMALPFGLVGVVVGHLLLGYDLTLMSLFGAVALSGVVVNDSLVLVDAINRSLREGNSVKEAVFRAGEARFRAVVLTSITTVAGLLPLLLERSTHAQAVIPMAISLAFGIMFATVLTLFVVPASFLVVNDVRRMVHWLRYGGDYPEPELVEAAAHDELLKVE